MCVSIDSGFVFCFVSAEIFESMKAPGDEWVLANHNVVGYYRVNYDQSNWDKLLKTLSTDHKVRLSYQTCHQCIC